MRKLIKKIASATMAFILILGLATTQVFAIDNEASSYMQYWTNTSSSYNIHGNVNGSWYQTTYGNGGYLSVIVVDGTTNYLSYMENGVEKTIGETGVTQNLSLVNNGRYVKIQYVVRNLSESAQTISLGSCSDVMIGGNDYAPIYSFSDWSGFYMTDGSAAQFNFIGKNAYGVTNVDTYWYGHYSGRLSNMFNQVSAPSLTGTDSGMAFSWKDRVIQPGAAQTFSVLIGIGAVNAAPGLSITNPETTFGDVTNGGSYEFAGAVTDAENTTGTKVYYAIDQGLPVLAYTFDSVPGSFTTDLNIPSDLATGAHTVTFYAQDSAGAISSSVTRSLNVTQTFTVTWLNEDGSVLETDTDVAYGTTPTYDGATPVKDADAQYTYTFNAWTPAIESVDGDVEYTATYINAVNTYTLSFDTNGGSTVDSIENIQYGTTLYVSAIPTLTGSTFEGWYQDEALTKEWDFAEHTITGDTTLYAKWTPTAVTEKSSPISTGDNGLMVAGMYISMAAAAAGLIAFLKKTHSK